MGWSKTMDEAQLEDFLSMIHHALRAPRRRRTIQIIRRDETAVITVRQLAREIAARELDVPQDNATGEPYRNVYNALSQTHLPTLMDAGIVIYDPQRQTVSRGQRLAIASLLLAINESAITTLEDVDFRTLPRSI